MHWKFSEFSECRESDKSLKHDWGQLKHSFFHLCLASTVIASLALTLEAAGSKPSIDKHFGFRENTIVEYLSIW